MLCIIGVEPPVAFQVTPLFCESLVTVAVSVVSVWPTVSPPDFGETLTVTLDWANALTAASGARTKQHAAATLIDVAPPMPESSSVSAVLRDLEEAPSNIASATSVAEPKRGFGLLVALLVLVAAAATAAVVYFVLPYFT